MPRIRQTRDEVRATLPPPVAIQRFAFEQLGADRGPKALQAERGFATLLQLVALHSRYAAFSISRATTPFINGPHP